MSPAQGRVAWSRGAAAHALAALALVLVVAAAAQARPWSWLGVRIRDLSEQEMEELSRKHGIREGFGVVVVEVLDDTPAARAGVQNGDVVVALGERPVTDTRMLQRLIAATPPGEDTALTVLRTEGRRRLTARLVTMPPPIAGERVAAEFGFAIREPVAGPGPGGQRPAPGPPSVGIVVRGSSAERAGLETGDVILQVGERPVVSREAAREALADASLALPLRLTVRRGERQLPLTMPAVRPAP